MTDGFQGSAKLADANNAREPFNQTSDWNLRMGPFFELGTVYTLIAGLLNILAIYDAWGGPAALQSPQPSPEKKVPQIPMPLICHGTDRDVRCAIWYSLPLIVSISLVYSATRHEEAGPILRHALRLGLWITGFMAVVFAPLYWLASGL